MLKGDIHKKDDLKNALYQKLCHECVSLVPGEMLSDSFRNELEIFPMEDRRDIVNRIESSRSPFFIACFRGLAEVVEYMISECSADIEQKGSSDFLNDSSTPLWCAAVKGCLPVIEILLTHGADINPLSEKSGLTPVLSACELIQNKGVVECLVEHGADINRSDLNGNTCLMKALHNTPLCGYLLKQGADINAVDFENKTALYHAVYHEREESMKLLLKNGANPYIFSIYGDDALQVVCLRSDVPVFEYLVKNIKYSAERLANALEVMGMILYSEQRSMGEALNHWKLALEVRTKHGLFPKQPIMPLRDTYQFTKEFESVEELDVIRINSVKQRIQSLLVAERCLGPHHEKTLYMLTFVGCALYYSGHHSQFVEIWKRSIKLRIEKFSLLTPEIVAYVECILTHTLNHFNDLPKNAENNQQKLHDIVQIFKLTTEDIVDIRTLLMVQPTCETQSKCFDSILMCITRLIYIMLETVTEENRQNVLRLIFNFLKKNVKTVVSGDTVLHLFISLKELRTSPQERIVRSLLNCEVEINARNKEGSSPLYTAMLPDNFSVSVVKLLLEYGAHDDQPNNDNITPLDLIIKMNQSSGTCINVFKYSTLKCLCARVVAKNKIPYRNELPETLRKWMALHEPETLSKADKIANLCSKFVSLIAA